MVNINTKNEFIQKALSYGYFPSLTKNAVQTFSTPTEFPHCPQNITKKPLEDYLNNLQKGKLFSKNKYYTANIVKAKILEYDNSILVLCESMDNNNEKCLSAFEITCDQIFFIHSYKRKFDSIELANKYIDYTTGKIPFDDNDPDLFEFECM